MNALHNLVDILQVKPLTKNRFSGEPGPGDFRIYGGLTVTQAIDAARQCCPAEFALQSLHGQFLRPGDHQHPVIIDVEELKDGRRFKLYNVYCRQQGNTIFFATVTFHLPEARYEHTLPAPALELPAAEHALFYAHRQSSYTAAQAADTPVALEVRIEQKNAKTESLAPTNITWVKTTGNVPISAWQQTLLLAYISDWNLPDVALRPHRIPEDHQQHVASLDHAIWFYRQPDLHDWIAYVQDSPAALNSRGHSRGLIYSHQGDLLACVNQESYLSSTKKNPA